MKDTNGSYRLGDQVFGTRFPARGIFICFSVSRTALGPTKLHIEWVSWLKRPRCEANHSSPSSNEIKNGELYLNSPYVIMARFLTN